MNSANRVQLMLVAVLAGACPPHPVLGSAKVSFIPSHPVDPACVSAAVSRVGGAPANIQFKTPFSKTEATVGSRTRTFRTSRPSAELYVSLASTLVESEIFLPTGASAGQHVRAALEELEEVARAVEQDCGVILKRSSCTWTDGQTVQRC